MHAFAHVSPSLFLSYSSNLPIQSKAKSLLLANKHTTFKMPTREIVPIIDNPDLFGNSLNFEMNESLIQMNESFTSNESLQPAETNESSNNTKQPAGKQPAEKTDSKAKAKGKGKVVVKRKKRGKYNSYKSEEGQRRVKNAIETFLERRRKNGKASLRAFAAEVDIKYETLKPYCREDESKRKKFVFVGQAKLVPDAQMDAFCKRMVIEQPDLDRTKIIDAFLTQFHNLQFDYKAACNQYDRIIKKK